VNITLTGASGFLGVKLVDRLLRDGHRLHVVGRKRSDKLPAGVGFSAWDATAGPPPPASVAEADVVFNLLGEPVAQRWTDEVKRKIRESRCTGTRHLVQALSNVNRKPAALVSASAVGYYGDRGEETLVETSAPGVGYLPEVCVEWERQALKAEELGVRVALPRIGLVLGNGGALAEMVKPFKLGVGGPLGSGQQWMPWIHIDDLIEMFILAMSRDHLHGPFNGVSPNPVRNIDFTKALGKAVHRPAILPVPKFALKLMFGEMMEIAIGSQRVLPAVPEREGFQFRFPELSRTLASLLN
jgi:uncharacterized protein (TIGR01777 family)